jgi:putative redox protein
MGKVTSYYKGDMLFETKVGNHTVVNDVPPTPAWGGKDRSPTPPDDLIVSISSCIAAFVIQYCKTSGINTQDMSVDVTFDKEEKPAFLKNIDVKVNLPHAEVKDRKDAIRRVCEHCTVHETLTKLEHINIEVIDKSTPSNS